MTVSMNSSRRLAAMIVSCARMQGLGRTDNINRKQHVNKKIPSTLQWNLQIAHFQLPIRRIKDGGNQY